MTEAAANGDAGQGAGAAQAGAAKAGEAGTPPAFRETWAQEYQTDPALKNYDNVNDLLKSHKSVQALVGVDKADIVRKPRPGAPEGEVNEYLKAIGRPDTPGDYQAPVIEGYTFDEKSVNAFKEAAYKAGIPAEQFKEVLKFQSEQDVAARHAAKEAREQADFEGAQQIKQDWGAAFDAKQNAWKKAVQHNGGEELLKKLNKAGLVNDPQVANILATLGEAMGETAAIGGVIGMSAGRALTPNEAKLKLNELEASPDYVKKLAAGDKDLIAKRSELFGYMFPEKQSA